MLTSHHACQSSALPFAACHTPSPVVVPCFVRASLHTARLAPPQCQSGPIRNRWHVGKDRFAMMPTRGRSTLPPTFHGSRTLLAADLGPSFSNEGRGISASLLRELGPTRAAGTRSQLQRRRLPPTGRGYPVVPEGNSVSQDLLAPIRLKTPPPETR